MLRLVKLPSLCVACCVALAAAQDTLQGQSIVYFEHGMVDIETGTDSCALDSALIQDGSRIPCTTVSREETRSGFATTTFPQYLTGSAGTATRCWASCTARLATAGFVGGEGQDALGLSAARFGHVRRQNRLFT